MYRLLVTAMAGRELFYLQKISAMKPEIKTTEVCIYELTNKSFLCPDSSLKIGAIVAGIPDGKRVDPLGKYRFVIDDNGQTHSVSVKFLKLLEKKEVHWVRQVMERIKVATETLKQFK